MIDEPVEIISHIVQKELVGETIHCFRCGFEDSFRNALEREMLIQNSIGGWRIEVSIQVSEEIKG